MEWIDSHSHHYLTSLSILDELRKTGLSTVVEASWIPVRPTSQFTLIDLYNWIVNQEKTRLERIGLKVLPAIGIHPRWLESGDDIETYVFERQLRMAMQADKPVIMHTPKANKKNILKKELDSIKSVSFPQELLVVDHLNSEIYEVVSNLKTYFGLSIQPGKLTVDEALKLVQKLDIERILINSDSSTEPSQPTWPALLLSKLENSGLTELARKIAFENPIRFYRL